jgi:hypothetical protein
MPKYIIERDIPGLGSLSAEEVRKIAEKSNCVLRNLGPEIHWLHSYATQDKLYCIYIAPNEEMIREHARKGGVPADRISMIRGIIDPTTAETESLRAGAD